MKRLTISGDACTETLALLIMMAWADGRLDDKEKEGVRAAAGVLNLTKELRDRLDQLLEKPMTVDELLVESLTPKDRAFAFVAASWMAGVDEEIDPKEQELLDKAAEAFGITGARKVELEQVAKDLPPVVERSWTQEIVSLFRAIPQRLEGEGEAVEVAFGE
jgi:uncharacterized membrane protein YebE (DUF533 family)